MNTSESPAPAPQVFSPAISLTPGVQDSARVIQTLFAEFIIGGAKAPTAQCIAGIIESHLALARMAAPRQP